LLQYFLFIQHFIDHTKFKNQGEFLPKVIYNLTNLIALKLSILVYHYLYLDSCEINANLKEIADAIGFHPSLKSVELSFFASFIMNYRGKH